MVLILSKPLLRRPTIDKQQQQRRSGGSAAIERAPDPRTARNNNLREFSSLFHFHFSPINPSGRCDAAGGSIEGLCSCI